MIEKELFEVTTQIGCPVACLKYCPQEIITRKYNGNRSLTSEAFAKLIRSIPPRVPINFSGVCEPFANPNASDMILYAHDHFHGVIVFSTLTGLNPHNAERISDIPFEDFVLHLPDACGNAHIPMNTDYFMSLKTILYGVKNISYMSMNEPFVSNNAETIARCESNAIHSGRVICFRHEIPNLNMMPNGDVYFCCICRGLTEKVGTLYESTYEELVDRIKPMSLRMQTDVNSICHRCGYAIPWWRYQLRKLKALR